MFRFYLLFNLGRPTQPYAPAGFLFGVFVIGTALIPNLGMTQYDIKRVLLLVFLLVGFGYFLAIAKKNKVSIGNWSSVCWLLFILSQLGNTYFMNNQLYGLVDTLFLFAISVAFLGYMRVLSDCPELKQYMLLALVYGLAVYYGFMLLQYLFFLISPVPWTIHLLSEAGFVNVRFLNQLMILIFPLVLFAEQLGPMPRRLARFTAVMTVALLLNSNGRGALAMAIFESILLVLFIKYTPCDAKIFRHRLLKIWLLGCLVFAVLFVWVPSLRLDDFQMSPLRLTEYNRFDMWREAFELWLKNKWWGHGGMSYASKSGSVTFFVGHPHNSLVQVLYEYGLLGFISLAAALSFLLKQVYFQLRNVPENRLLVPVFVGLLGGAGLSLVSGVIAMPFSQLVLFVLMLVLVSIVNVQSEGHASWLFRRQFYLSVNSIKLVGFVVFFLLATVSYMSWRHTMGQDVISFSVGPRFWLVGSLEI
jgi:O-antigen ligase